MVNYDDYDYDYEPVKKKQNNSSRKQKVNRAKLLFVFVSTFFAVLISFLVIARMVTPNVDIPEAATEEEEDSSENDSFRRRIDARLLGILEEEKGPQQSEVNDSKDQSATDHDKTAQRQDEAFDDSDKVTNKTSFDDDFFKDNNKTSPSSSPAPGLRPDTPAPPVPSRTNRLTAADTTAHQETISPTYKVLVGSYSTPEEARLQAKDMTSQGYNVTPFVRLINGRYAVQVGSFNDVEKARSTANNLNHYFDGVQIIKEF